MTWKELKEFLNQLPEEDLDKKVVVWTDEGGFTTYQHSNWIRIIISKRITQMMVAFQSPTYRGWILTPPSKKCMIKDSQSYKKSRGMEIKTGSMYVDQRGRLCIKTKQHPKQGVHAVIYSLTENKISSRQK